MSDTNSGKKRNVSVPDFRKESAGEYKFSNQPPQKKYRREIEKERIERKAPASKGSVQSTKGRVTPGAKSRTTQAQRTTSRPTQRVSNSRIGAGSTGNKQPQTNASRQVAANGGVTSRPRKKKKKFGKNIGFVVMCMVAIVIGGMLGRVKAQMNEILNQRNQASIDLNEVTIDESTLDSDSEIVNLLLIGADKREDWSEEGRSDCVMVATIDKKHKRLKLTSLMRDMYVEIPNHGSAKFNAAYSYGGVSLLYQTIAYNFDLKLDGYVLVDFAAFIKAINKVGGVDVELTEAEAHYLQTAYHHPPVTQVKVGMQTLNGKQALAYSRIRQDAAADFGRTARQRTVIQALFTKAKTKSYTQLVDLAGTVMPYITTDLSNEEIFGYMSDVIRMGTTTIDQKRIPVDNSYVQQRINTQCVLAPDLTVNKKELQDFIFRYKGEETPE